MPPEDDLEEVLPRLLGQVLDAHVVDNEQFGLQILRQRPILPGEGLIRHQFPHQIEDRAVQHIKPQPNRLVAESLDQMTFSHARRAEQEDIPGLADEVTRRQFVDPVPLDARIKRPVEPLERLEFPEAGGSGSPFELTLIPDVELILNEQFQEFLMAQTVALGLLHSNFQARGKARKPKLFEHRFESVLHNFRLRLKNVNIHHEEHPSW